jgi:hypothetical protein
MTNAPVLCSRTIRRRCEAVVVEEVPWGNGKHHYLTSAAHAAE